MDIHLTRMWMLIATIAALLLVASIVSYLVMPSSASRGKKLLLIGLRTLAVAAALILLLDPHLTKQETFREEMELAVLLDASASMAFTDEVDGRTRYEAARHYLSSQLQPSLDADYTLKFYTFGDSAEPAADLGAVEPRQTQSDLAAALEKVLAEGRDVPLGGMVVLSDGQFADDEALRKATQKLRKSGIPMFTYAVGRDREAADISLVGVSGGQLVPFEPRVRITARIDSPGFAGRETTLSVRRGERLLFEKRVRLSGQPQEEAVEFTTPYRGFFTYNVSLSVQDGERLGYNNVRSLGIDVLDRKIHVLYMEGTPGQTHFLEDSLETDPDIEVTSLYFPQSFQSFEQAKSMPYRTDVKQRRIYNVSHPQRGYPATLEGLLQYDVVINSDIYRQAFTQEQLDNTVAFVENYGGGFVMIGGVTAFGAGHYDETVIDKLMPVDAYGARDFEWAHFNLEVPEKALEHPIMQVGDDAEETRKAWTERFPGLGGLNRANRPKPGAVSLALHGTRSNQYGKLVVFAAQQIGRGRTMAFTSDTTDDWGRGFQRTFGRVDDPTYYYRRFWNNAIRWLAADRIQRKNSELTVHADPNHAVVGQPVTVSISLPEAALPGTLNLRCDVPGGEPQLVETRLDPITESLRAEIRLQQVGEHIFTARWQKTKEVALFAKCLVTVDEDRREEATTRANPALLADLARVTNAASLNDKDRNYVAGTLGELGTEYVEYRESSAWDTFPVLAMFLAVLSGEWLLRRRSGYA